MCGATSDALLKRGVKIQTLQKVLNHVTYAVHIGLHGWKLFAIGQSPLCQMTIIPFDSGGC